MSVFFFPARWGVHEAGASVGRSARSLGESIDHGLVHGLKYLGLGIVVGLIGAAIINKM